LFGVFGSAVAEFTIAVFTARLYGVVAVVTTVIVAVELAANDVKLHVRTPAAWVQVPPVPPEIEDET
jgi:hypothetical protein